MEPKEARRLGNRSFTQLVLSVLAASAVIAAAQPLQLRPGTPLMANGINLAPGSYAIPCVTDWNGDGRKDLLVGYQSAGKIAVYLNSGTDATPVFTTPANLQAGGADIYLPSGGCGAPAPWVCDYDNDGRRDLLVGEGASGFVYFYRNTNTDANPILASGVQLSANGSPINLSLRATPYVYDWDGDGLKDLLCGNGNGYVYFFRNFGTAQSPAYGPSTLLQAGGATLNLGIRSVVRVFDWDGDGVNDLVGSADGYMNFCKNTGSATNPVLAAPVQLRVPDLTGTLVPIYNTRLRLDAVDWNNDGVMDLLVGNYTGTVIYYEGYRFGFEVISRQPDQVRFQWRSAPYLRYQVLAGPTLNAITNVAVASLPSAGNTTSWTNRADASQQFFRVHIAP